MQNIHKLRTRQQDLIDTMELGSSQYDFLMEVLDIERKIAKQKEQIKKTNP